MVSKRKKTSISFLLDDSSPETPHARAPPPPPPRKPRTRSDDAPTRGTQVTATSPGAPLVEGSTTTRSFSIADMIHTTSMATPVQVNCEPTPSPRANVTNTLKNKQSEAICTVPTASFALPTVTVESFDIAPVASDSVVGGAEAQVQAKSTQKQMKKRAKRKRKKQNCRFDGCTNKAVDHGVCGQHGGGKRCSVEDCERRVQRNGLCWKHGGYRICTVENCDNRAKARGMCAYHGGAEQCSVESCQTTAVSNGLCWAHGGGQRCSIDGCRRLAYKKKQNYCLHHFNRLILNQKYSDEDSQPSEQASRSHHQSRRDEDQKQETEAYESGHV